MKIAAARLVNHRIRLLLACFALAFAGMLLRAVWLQAVRAQSFDRLAATQHRQTVTIPARRGTLYDRTGVQLAIGEQATTVYADPRQVHDASKVAVAAGSALGLDADALYRKLADPSRRFAYVKRKADAEDAAALARRKLAGLGFYPEERRFYPQGTVAAHVLGYAGVDNKGLAGLELALDRTLGGRPGRETIVRDPFGRVIDIVSSTAEREGRDVSLTLDHRIQAHAEAVLRETTARWSAKRATAIVLNPRTGGILAMAVAPAFDANEFPEASRDLQRNTTVTDTYEPGSTFKVVTVAAALSDRLVTPRTAFTLPYSVRIADRVIHDAEPRGTERMTVAQILSQSSNVGAITLATMLGKERLASWIRRFGFGRRTGVDFPGESTGIAVPAERWSGSTIGNVPIGQGIAVTPVQMAAAYGALANKGVWVQPHLVARAHGREGTPPKRRRVVSRRVVGQLSGMLRGVVAEGSGQRAAIPGYHVAGKTGTAAKPDPAGGYSDSRYVASFVGFVPATAPRLVVLVTVDEPRGVIWGGVVAAPAFQEIARFSLQYLEIPPDAPLVPAATDE